MPKRKPSTTKQRPRKKRSGDERINERIFEVRLHPSKAQETGTQRSPSGAVPTSSIGFGMRADFVANWPDVSESVLRTISLGPFL